MTMASSDHPVHAETVATATAGEEPPPDPRVGQVIAERYRIVERIGRGGMGAIYEAEHLLTGKRFAVKTLLPGLGRVSEIARRFEREARAASLLNHPNVVSVVDFGSLEDGALFLVMELVRGRSLGDELERAPLGAPRAFSIARQVLEALAHAHRQGIVHRDLKPDNIMLLNAGDSDEERDIVKLLDFGIAKLVGEAAAEGGDKLTQAGVAFGTPDYMSPEQALGEEVDGRADLYAMGVILFEMLAGRRPFVVADKMAVLRMQVSVPPPTLAEAAPDRIFAAEVEAVVALALAKRREDRCAVAEEMIAALDRAQAAQDRLDDQTAGEIAGATAKAIADSEIVLPPTGDSLLTPSLHPAPAAPAPPAPAPPAPAPEPLVVPAARIRRLAVAIGAAFALLVALAIVADLVRRGPVTATPDRRLALPRAIAVPPPSPLSLRARTLLASGDVAGAVDLLERELATPAGKDDATAHLVLGHALILSDRDIEGIAAYERGLFLAPALAGNQEMVADMKALLGDKDRRVAFAAFDLLRDRGGPPARDTVIELASHGPKPDLRKRARDAAEKLDLLGRVDLLSSYSLDLQQGKTCKDRREAVPKLRALNDKRAIPLLKKAANRSGGFLGLADVNDCLEKDAEEAIAYLEALE